MIILTYRVSENYVVPGFTEPLAPGHPGIWLYPVSPNACGLPVWKLLHVTLLAPRILMCLLDFWKICEPQILAPIVVMDSW